MDTPLKLTRRDVLLTAASAACATTLPEKGDNQPDTITRYDPLRDITQLPVGDGESVLKMNRLIGTALTDPGNLETTRMIHETATSIADALIKAIPKNNTSIHTLEDLEDIATQLRIPLPEDPPPNNEEYVKFIITNLPDKAFAINLPKVVLQLLGMGGSLFILYKAFQADGPLQILGIPASILSTLLIAVSLIPDLDSPDNGRDRLYNIAENDPDLALEIAQRLYDQSNPTDEKHVNQLTIEPLIVNTEDVLPDIEGYPTGILPGNKMGIIAKEGRDTTPLNTGRLEGRDLIPIGLSDINVASGRNGIGVASIEGQMPTTDGSNQIIYRRVEAFPTGTNPVPVTELPYTLNLDRNPSQVSLDELRFALRIAGDPRFTGPLNMDMHIQLRDLVYLNSGPTAGHIMEEACLQRSSANPDAYADNRAYHYPNSLVRVTGDTLTKIKILPGGHVWMIFQADYTHDGNPDSYYAVPARALIEFGGQDSLFAQPSEETLVFSPHENLSSNLPAWVIPVGLAAVLSAAVLTRLAKNKN